MWSVQSGVAKNTKVRKIILEKMMTKLNKSFTPNILGNDTDGKKLTAS